MSRFGSLANRLYRGDVSIDFVGRRKIWYALSAAVLVISIASLLIRGLHLGIDFRGGAVFEVNNTRATVSQAQAALAGQQIVPEVVQKVGQNNLRIETKSLTTAESTQVQRALASSLHVSQDDVAVSTVGPTWGSQITRKALVSLGIFLVAVLAYLSVRYDPKMALAAFAALIHDIVITAGVYSLVGFEVTPATVIALLTILGYSLYDTVVVFDRVRENTMGLAGGSRMTFSQAANLALNQTLIRSINTSIIALLPVAALLFIGAGVLGAGTLEDLALALFIGLAVGAYSSIFIATPLLCDLKERESQYQALARRVDARQGAARPAVPAGVPAVAAGAAAGSTALTADGDGAPVSRRSSRAPARQPVRSNRAGRPSGKRRR